MSHLLLARRASQPLAEPVIPVPSDELQRFRTALVRVTQETGRALDIQCFQNDLASELLRLAGEPNANPGSKSDLVMAAFQCQKVKRVFGRCGNASDLLFAFVENDGYRKDLESMLGEGKDKLYRARSLRRRLTHLGVALAVLSSNLASDKGWDRFQDKPPTFWSLMGFLANDGKPTGALNPVIFPFFGLQDQQVLESYERVGPRLRDVAVAKGIHLETNLSKQLYQLLTDSRVANDLCKAARFEESDIIAPMDGEQLNDAKNSYELLKSFFREVSMLAAETSVPSSAAEPVGARRADKPTK